METLVAALLAAFMAVPLPVTAASDAGSGQSATRSSAETSFAALETTKADRCRGRR